jgi:CO dehydrogenase maturation factor
MEFRNRDYHPIIVDADESNSVLYRMLGINKPPQPLVALAGGRQMVRQLMPPGYTPGESDDVTNVLAQAKISITELPSENIAKENGIRLIVIGKIVDALEGCACPMGVLGREFLNKLQLEDRDIVIVDMEAGLEHFGRGVETALDSVLMVIEPSFESINLAERIQQMAQKIDIKHICAVLNKAASKAVTDKLVSAMSERNIRIVGSVPYDEAVFTACLDGQPLPESQGELAESLHSIVDKLIQQHS